MHGQGGWVHRAMTCYEAVEVYGLVLDGLDFAHCPTCHFDNVFDDDLCLEHRMPDDRHADLCCKAAEALRASGVAAVEDDS